LKCIYKIVKCMIDRSISVYISEISNEFSVISLLGPRQSGKTTLVKSLFPSYGYVNFEDVETLADARRDLKLFMREHPAPVIFDEVQQFPDILRQIQVWVDEHPFPKAQFILTGSDQPHLRGAISESLAGRIGIAYLLPLSFAELRGIAEADRSGSVYKGFMPRIFSEGATPERLYENYISTYVMRDVNRLINLKDRVRFTTFITLLAARVGQLLNYNSISDEIGVSVNTIKDWVSVLEASFIVFRLQPYARNYGRRFVKTPKIYFTEVGLAAHLLGMRTSQQAERDPLFGQLFENMVVADIRKNRFNSGNYRLGTAGMYFFRDNIGNEVDLVIEAEGRKLDLVEIKSGMTFNADYAKSIEKYAKLIGDDYHSGKVIYAGRRTQHNGIDFVHFAE